MDRWTASQIELLFFFLQPYRCCFAIENLVTTEKKLLNTTLGRCSIYLSIRFSYLKFEAEENLLATIFKSLC